MSAQAKEWGDVSPSEPQTESRAKWFENTRGDNLALGREVWFSKKPNWRHTAREDDPFKLTTGRLSERADDRLLWAPDAVGWRETGPILMLADLGEKQPVGRVAIRFLGGAEYPMFAFPKTIEVVASEDGKNFYRIARMVKLLPSDKELADWKKTYYLPEEQKTYVHTFVFDVDVNAKVIGFNVEPPGTFLVTDQLAVLRGEKGRNPSEIPEAIPFESRASTLAFLPRKKDMVITTNMVTPTWLELEDHRAEGERTDFASLIFELPKEIELLEGSIGQITPPEPEEGEETRRWTVSNLDVRPAIKNNGMTGYGPFYLRLREGSTWPENAKATLITKVEDCETHRTQTTLRPVEVPAVGAFKDAHISLGWMTEPYAMAWPDFLKTYRALGFNTFPIFPRYYDWKKSPDAHYRDYPKSEILAFVERVRQAGLRILYNESPFHVLQWQGHPETFNQLNNDKTGRYLSPVYRGKFYQEEIQRVGKWVELLQPDIIFWDIELWHASVDEARLTRTFRRALALSKKSETEMLSDLGLETLADLREEVHARSTNPPPIGLYNNHPGNPVYGYLYEWKRIYPATVDFAMPSLYVQGNVARVRETIRSNREALGKSKIIPWLTTGTYGEFDSFLVEPMILEAFLNGASGITYYSFFDFDPEDFYYHAKALALLHPYQDLLASGTPAHGDSGNDAVASSLFKNNREALLMLSNYGSARPLQARVAPVFSEGGEIRDAVSGETLSAAELNTLSIPGQGFRLLHFTNKNTETSPAN